VTGSESQRMERNIKAMSEEYLERTELAVEAKRGRNVEKYRTYSEEAENIYHYIGTYISSLNNEQFKSNSANYAVLSLSLRYVEVVNTVVLIVVAISNIILVVMVIRNITRPLKSLSTVANQVAGGNLDVELLEVSSQDEVGIVSYAFNQMIISIRNYIDRLKDSMNNERTLKEKELKMETHLKDAQLKYLQAQINPHFLFNTLNAGAQLAMMEDADRTYEYIQNVADFFRYNIKKDHDNVTLREELELVDNYIYILNVRFSGEFHYEKDVDTTLENLTVPSMILQPIVENSVNYGVRDIAWEGKIKLSVYREGDFAYIRIEDNGIGMEQEKIEKIMSVQLEPSDVHGDSNGIGLDNVISRLKLFYDREDVLEISSPGLNKGTCVVIRIPLQQEKEKIYV
jgi:sensor histidine kinase YesM